MLMEAVPGLVKTRLYSGQPVRFHVHTTSMIPLIHPGDVLVVHRLGMEKPEPGTLLVVHTGCWWLVHRLLVWKTSEDLTTIVTKGDNLYRIARKNNIDLARLKELNNISDDTKIKPGQILIVK